MRLANRNEVITLLGDKAFGFTQYCLTPDGAAFGKLMDWTDSFDLDLEMMQGMLAQLLAVNVIDQACVDRFAAFSSSVSVDISTHYMHEYHVPIPEGAHGIEYVSQYLTQSAEVTMVASSLALVKTDGECNAPDATEVL